MTRLLFIFRMQFNLTITCPNSICFSIMKSENFQLSSQKSFSSEVCVAIGQKKEKLFIACYLPICITISPISTYRSIYLWENSKGCFLKQLWTMHSYVEYWKISWMKITIFDEILYSKTYLKGIQKHLGGFNLIFRANVILVSCLFHMR